MANPPRSVEVSSYEITKHQSTLTPRHVLWSLPHDRAGLPQDLQGLCRQSLLPKGTPNSADRSCVGPSYCPLRMSIACTQTCLDSSGLPGLPFSCFWSTTSKYVNHPGSLPSSCSSFHPPPDSTLVGCSSVRIPVASVPGYLAVFRCFQLIFCYFSLTEYIPKFGEDCSIFLPGFKGKSMGHRAIPAWNI